MKYSLASAPGDAKPRPRGPAIVLPGADAAYLERGAAALPLRAPPAAVEADEYFGEDFSDIDTSDSDLPEGCEDPDEARAIRKRAMALPEDDEEIDVVEEQLQQELGMARAATLTVSLVDFANVFLS